MTTKTFKTKIQGTNYWTGLAKQTIDFQYALGELVDNGISATLPKPSGAGRQTATIEVTLEELADTNIRLCVADAGTGIPESEIVGEDNVFNVGYVPPSRGAMNEHGFGLKNALALMTGGFATAFTVLSKPVNSSSPGILKVRGPITEDMLLELTDEAEWSQNLFTLHQASSGVKVVIDVRRDYFNSLYVRGQTFDTLTERLGEHLGVMYANYIDKGSEIFFSYKSKGAQNWTHRSIIAIPTPFLSTAAKLEQEIVVEIDGKTYKAKYITGTLDKAVKDMTAGRPWPFPLRIHFQGSNARCGVSIVVRDRVLRTGVFKEIWPDKSGDVSFNNFLGELQLTPEFQTTNNKSDLNTHSEVVARMLEKLEAEFPPENTTRQQSEESLRKKLVAMYASTHELKGTEKPRKHVVWGGGGEIDIFFEKDGKATCIETKVQSAFVLDLYQLQMYWDGLVESGKVPAKGILIAKDFSPYVLQALAHLNAKKDKLGNPYIFECKKISEYPV